MTPAEHIAALEHEVTRLRDRKVGRPAASPSTPDGWLVAAVCHKLGLTRTELARRMQGEPRSSLLSRCNLSEERRAELRGMLAAKEK